MLPTLLLFGILLEPGSVTSVQVKPGVLKPRLLTTISNASATPATITFAATDPYNIPVVSGSSSVVVYWQTAGGSLGAWLVKVSAAAAFTSCPTVPASAVTVSCSSIVGGQIPVVGICGSSFALSTTATSIASGLEPSVTSASYSVTLGFTLQDSWKYIASSSCSLPVSYTIIAN